MQIKVESTSGHKDGFRLTFSKGEREWIEGYRWTRKQAKEALDIAEHVYGYTRKNVRFVHH